MKTANSDQIERAFRLGLPIDDAVKRAVQLAKNNRPPLKANVKPASTLRSTKKNK